MTVSETTADFKLAATITDAQPTHPAVFPPTTGSQSHKPTEALASKINDCELSSRIPYICHPQSMCELRSLAKITKVRASRAKGLIFVDKGKNETYVAGVTSVTYYMNIRKLS